MTKLLMAAAGIVLGLALLPACAGGDAKVASSGEADAPAAGGRVSGALAGSEASGTVAGGGASGAAAGGRKLNDCQYATALVRSLEKFTTALPSSAASGSGGKEAAIKAFDTFDGELAALVAELKSYRLSADVARVNAGVVSVFEDARKLIPELKTAVGRGDVVSLTQVSAKLTEDIFPRLDAIQTANQRAMDRLNKCVEA